MLLSKVVYSSIILITVNCAVENESPEEKQQDPSDEQEILCILQKILNLKMLHVTVEINFLRFLIYTCKHMILNISHMLYYNKLIHFYFYKCLLSGKSRCTNQMHKCK